MTLKCLQGEIKTSIMEINCRDIPYIIHVLYCTLYMHTYILCKTKSVKFAKLPENYNQKKADGSSTPSRRISLWSSASFSTLSLSRSPRNQREHAVKLIGFVDDCTRFRALSNVNYAKIQRHTKRSGNS